jgi:arginase
MTRTFGLLGVPSSAGAHWPGQEQTPAALRAAELISHLTNAGVALVDYGDLPSVRCRTERTTNPAQVLAQIRAVALQLAGKVEQIVRAGQRPLIIGGDCTITLGVLAGSLREHPDLALLYPDGGTETA